MTPRRSFMCREVIDLLGDYLGVALAEPDVEALERHLADCPPCRAYLATYRKTARITARAMDAEMPDELEARLRDFLRRGVAGGARTRGRRASPD